MNQICMGIWGNRNRPERFAPGAVDQDLSVIARIRQVGEVDGIDGIELHYPTELNEANAEEIGTVLEESHLRIVQLSGHIWGDPYYKFGALSHSDARIRQFAINRLKRTLDMDARFEVPLCILCPVTDGNDFPLQADYHRIYDRYIASIQEILEYLHSKNYGTKLCVEPKPFDPRSHMIMSGVAETMCIINEIHDEYFGLNLHLGHMLIAGENVEEQIALAGRYQKIYHVHLDDNDQKFDASLPPGTVNLNRLIMVMYLLDQEGYREWMGLDLSPASSHPKEYMELSVANIRLAQKVVHLMNQKGAKELRESGIEGGAAMARLVQASLREAML